MVSRAASGSVCILLWGRVVDFNGFVWGIRGLLESHQEYIQSVFSCALVEVGHLSNQEQFILSRHFVNTTPQCVVEFESPV